MNRTLTQSARNCEPLFQLNQHLEIGLMERKEAELGRHHLFVRHRHLALLSLLILFISLTGSAQGVINAPPANGHAITVFPQRDFISAENYTIDDGPYTIEVLRNGVRVGFVADVFPGLDGLMEVNHPGGECWDTVTPDISPGDKIRITDVNSIADEITVANVTAERVVQESGDTIVIHGTAQAADGSPLPIGELEQRIIASSATPFLENGKRSLRAPGDGTLAYDPVDATTNPNGINWTATYTGLAPRDISLALSSESRVLWLGAGAPIFGTELTIFEIGDAVVAGPQAPCTAPLGLPALAVGARPKGGVYNRTQSVALSATNPAASIFYTLDGTDPSPDGTRYAQPLLISGPDPVTLKFMAVNASTSEQTGIVTEVYTFDTVSPTVTASPAGGLSRTAKTVTLASDKPGTIFYTTNGNDPTPANTQYTGPITVSVTTTLKFIARDTVGNLSQVGTETYVIDNIAPATPTVPDLEPGSDTGTSSSDNITNDTAPIFSGSAEPFSTVKLFFGTVLKGTVITDENGFYSVSNPSDTPIAGGVYTVKVTATDAAGNLSTASAALDVTIDVTAPTINLSTKPASVSNSANPSFAFTNSDTGSTVECSLSTGDDAFAPCTSPKSYTAQPDGDYTFKVNATDKAGNIGSATYQFTIKTVAPAAPTITSKPPNPSNSKDPSFAFTSADPNATFECSLSTGADAFSACTSPKSYTAQPDGSYTFKVRAKDAAGNVGAAASYAFVIRTTGPAVPSVPDLVAASDSGLSNTDNVTNLTTLSFSGTAAAGSTVKLFVDGVQKGSSTATTGSYTITASALTAAAHAVTATATDTAGNASAASAALSIRIDTAAPAAAITSTPANTSGSLSFGFSSEAGASLDCSLALSTGADAFSPCTSPKAYPAQAAGSYNFKVRARDVAGNLGGPASFSFTVAGSAGDTIPPVINSVPTPILGLNHQLSSGTTVPVKLTWAATDAGGIASYELQQSTNGGAFTAVALSPVNANKVFLNLAPGSTNTYRFQVRARDAAGNVSAFTLGPAFKVLTFQESSTSIAYLATWTTATLAGSYGGSVRFASAAGAKATLTFTGNFVSWVARKSSDRGIAEVWLDGVKVATVDLYSATAADRREVFVKAVSATATHKLEVRVLGTKNASSTGTRVDVDAFVVLQ